MSELDGLSAVLLKQARIAQRYDRVVLALACISVYAVIVSLVAAGLVYHAITYAPESKYFITDPQGKLHPVIPLDSPIATTADVTRYAISVVECVRNLDAVRIRAQINACRDMFEPAAWTQLLEDFKRDGVIAAIESAGAIQDAAAGAPVIIEQGIDPRIGRFAYTVEVPVRLSLTAGTEQRRNSDLTVTLRLVRVQTNQRPSGLITVNYVERQGG